MKKIAVGLCFWAFIIACSQAGWWLSEHPRAYAVVATFFGIVALVALSWVIGDLLLGKEKDNGRP